MVAGAALLVATAYALAQMPPAAGPGGVQGQMSGAMTQMHQQMMPGSGMHGPGMHRQFATPGEPSMAGQDAFGAIQEIVQMLQADPATDWSKVNIGALREHLIDMNEVTLNAAAAERMLDNGIEITVTGQGRTREAIKRMVPAHVQELTKIGWNAKSEGLPDGVKLTILASESVPVTKLKALGFMGIMVQGAHHQPHHLMIAKGEFPMH